ncbi:MAG: aldehyde dehydrogenase family protein [Tetrasphaera sp.]|jgi:succinate-semialdehyde dehydrogenase/glutarate-semialdehyde dehydrogenase|nr:aldehyde dehydrogenase family protein [Tetrasphaera sp.]
MATIVTRNPHTGGELAAYETMDADGVETACARAESAARAWAEVPVANRVALLRALGTLLTERRERYAALITAEMGKPITEALGEIDKCALSCALVADRAPEWLADEVVDTPAQRSWVAYRPLGVVVAVMPWNFPFWQVIRFACAALVAGNAGLLKHSPNVTGCALALEAVIDDAAAACGAPAHLLQALVVAEDAVPQVITALVDDDRIAAATLTGSERAGAAVGAAAGAALKKVVLELGGSDPFVVLDDADLDAAADAAIRSRFGNSGQSCIAAKRWIVQETVADAFVDRVLTRLDRLVAGDPADPTTTIGPMARSDLRYAVHEQVVATVAEGATLITGGVLPQGPGCHYPPTLLDHVSTGMTAARMETFGPVACVIRVRDDEEAVAAANATAYGLGASVWSQSDRGLAVGQRIRSGALFVNAVVASDARMPFGGIGRSGHGRELGAIGVREFTNVRTVWVGDGAGLPVIAE